MVLGAKFFYIQILIVTFSIISIKCDCRISFPQEVSLRPNIYKVIGSHITKIDHNINANNYLDLYQNDKVEAYCDINFTENYYKTNPISLKCDHGCLYVNEGSHCADKYLECSILKWNLYESSDNLPWCPSNVTSYILARPKHLQTGFDYLAGICYDIYKFEFNSVLYTLAAKHSEDMQPSSLSNFYTPHLQINNIEETFGSNGISPNSFENQQFSNWLNHSNYKFESILHYSKLNTTESVDAMLQFVWWQNLRQYNWQRYETALENHIESENKSYDVLAGVSGALMVPIIKNCSMSYSMQEVRDRNERSIPLYVWNYLKATKNSSEEYVIIGFNSPFNEFYSINDIVFCADKCQQIPWLKDIQSTFRYGIMGIVFCCNVDEVRKSSRLSGFPQTDIMPKPMQVEESTKFYF